MGTEAGRREPHARRGFRAWDRTGTILLNVLIWGGLLLYLFPMSYMGVTALKEDAQFLDAKSPLYPARAVTLTWQGKTYDIYTVPTAEGERRLALVNARRNDADFLDPAHPEAGLIKWQGRWRTLNKVYETRFAWESFKHIWQVADFPRALRNTLVVVILGEAAVLLSSILVAYGMARYPIPGENVLFVLLVATMLIPEKITLVPTYFLFVRVLGWSGTWLPLLAPTVFGNALLIFLLRQNFRSIPREVDEAAELDGAGPLRTLFSIVLPQSIPVVVTAGVLHFFYAWNETRIQSLYLPGRSDLYTVANSIQNYQQFFPPPNMLQVSALLAMSVPVIVLFLAQRLFMHDVLVTGTERRKR